PSGAGLGGGSSDAATTLIALNRLWKTGLDRTALMELARPLGADVPVFVFGSSAFAEGIGDILTEVELPQRAYLVFRPYGSVPTAGVFADPDLTRNTKPVKISVFADWHKAKTQKEAARPRIETGKFGCELFGRNDLQPVVMSRYENVRRMAYSLKELDFH